MIYLYDLLYSINIFTYTGQDYIFGTSIDCEINILRMSLSSSNNDSGITGGL